MKTQKNFSAIKTITSILLVFLLIITTVITSFAVTASKKVSEATVIKTQLTLNANGGKFSDGSSSITITCSKSGVLPNLTKAQIPTKSGYEFDGFYYTNTTSKNHPLYSFLIKTVKLAALLQGMYRYSRSGRKSKH